MFTPSLSLLTSGLLLANLATAAPAYAEGAKNETNQFLSRDLKTLQAYEAKITEDPNGHLATWKGDDVCAFDGTYCDYHPDGYLAVAGIDITGFGFGSASGLTLDGFLGPLTDITFFHANSNGFTGSIPADLSKIPYLYELDLSNNKFSGTFPTQVLSATQLTFLDLRFNSFTGPIPDAVFGLDLEVLYLNDNQFSGSLSTAIGKTPATYVALANNQLTGPIPAEIGQAKAIAEILLLGNQFTSLPDGPWLQVNMTVFDASLNQIAGKVPESLCGLEKLEVLNLTGNPLDQTLGPKCAALKQKGVLIL